MTIIPIRIAALACFVPLYLAASQQQGQVKIGEVAVPNAVVKASAGGATAIAITDDQGAYTFSNLADGVWTLQVDAPGFVPVTKQVTVASDSSMVVWSLAARPLNELVAAPAPATSSPATAAPGPVARAPRAPAPSRAEAAPPLNTPAGSSEASDAFLINGSANNAAISTVSQSRGFGNSRQRRALYNGNISAQVDNSALNAQSFSLTGLQTPKPGVSHVLGSVSLGGPLRIPHLLNNGPTFFFNYQRLQYRDATTQSSRWPTAAERNGDLSGVTTPIIDPATGIAFGGNQIPQSRISSQAAYLLSLFPSPNLSNGSRFNYQTALLSAMHEDRVQTRLNKALSSRLSVLGNFALTRTANDNPTPLGFLDKSNSLGLNGSVSGTKRIGQRSSVSARYQFSRLSINNTPFFSNRTNVSGQAGILGNDQSAANWGPPNLSFSSGYSSLTEVQNSLNRNQTQAATLTGVWNHRAHTYQYGVDFRRQHQNVLGQQNARGSWTFTGAATGSDFADYLLGLPATSAVSFGNADKYFRQSVYDAFISDDWRFRPGLTLNIGVRWEYEAPVSEKYGRTVNLDIGSGFRSATPTIGQSLHPDRAGILPRLSLAWRPRPVSSLVIRAGYGIYRDTSVYQKLIPRLAQQAPLSKNVQVQNDLSAPFTLANAFTTVAQAIPTFAINPDFRIATVHTWNAVVQGDLPGSLVLTATYSGSKGTRLMQSFLPNTYPVGAVNPCPSCPTGFQYLTSNGASLRQSADLQLRRRLARGFTATAQYIFTKATDNAGFTSAQQLVAQNWLDLNAESGRSSFDQRHQASFYVQYSTGAAVAGGMLMDGWRGTLFKNWTFTGTTSAGSGLPLTPIYPAPVVGTGISGSLRPFYNGGPLLSRSSYTAPLPGQWGNAARNSIPGPGTFSMNASLARTLRITDRISMDLRFDATNVLNHVVYPNWNMTVTSTQFGLPTSANAMRTIQSTIRLRF